MEIDQKEILLKILQDKPIAYHPDIAKAVGSVPSGVFLSQLFYWTGKGSDPDGWIYKTQKDWYKETGLSRRNQETARRNLIDMKILQEKLTGNPAQLFFKIDYNIFLNRLSSMYGSDKQECPVQPNSNPIQNAQSEQTRMSGSANLSLTKNTTKNTGGAENTTKESIDPIVIEFWNYWLSITPNEKEVLSKKKVNAIRATINQWSIEKLMNASEMLVQDQWSKENGEVNINRLVDTKNGKRERNMNKFLNDYEKKMAFNKELAAL